MLPLGQIGLMQALNRERCISNIGGRHRLWGIWFFGEEDQDGQNRKDNNDNIQCDYGLGQV